MSAEVWRTITADEYEALSGQEGGGFMGAVFKYDAGKIVGRRTFDEYASDKSWSYAAPVTPIDPRTP